MARALAVARSRQWGSSLQPKRRACTWPGSSEHHGLPSLHRASEHPWLQCLLSTPLQILVITNIARFFTRRSFSAHAWADGVDVHEDEEPCHGAVAPWRRSAMHHMSTKTSVGLPHLSSVQRAIKKKKKNSKTFKNSVIVNSSKQTNKQTGVIPNTNVLYHGWKS